MKNESYKTLFISIFIISFCFMTGCENKESQYDSEDKLGYLAYDEFKDDENLIYIDSSAKGTSTVWADGILFPVM